MVLRRQRHTMPTKKKVMKNRKQSVFTLNNMELGTNKQSKRMPWLKSIGNSKSETMKNQRELCTSGGKVRANTRYCQAINQKFATIYLVACFSSAIFCRFFQFDSFDLLNHFFPVPFVGYYCFGFFLGVDVFFFGTGTFDMESSYEKSFWRKPLLVTTIQAFLTFTVSALWKAGTGQSFVYCLI